MDKRYAYAVLKYPLFLKCTWFVICLITIFTGNAQDTSYTTISGRVIDAETKEPLPLSSIYIKGKQIGTTSNKDGSFIFHIPSNLTDFPVVISMIGYKSEERHPERFKKDAIIPLAPGTLQLSEVVITSGKPLTARQIVKKAYEAIVQNFPTEPYLMEGFFRDLQSEDGKYVEFSEYAAKFYYKSYDVTPLVELRHVRRSFIAKKHPWNDLWERKNSFWDLLEDDFIRYDYGPILGKKKWKYEIEGILPFNNRLVYKIIATDTPFQSALLYIDVETSAFVRIELTRQMSNGKYYKRRLTNGRQEISYSVVCEYQEFNGKMYLKYQKEEDTYKVFEDLESDRVLFTKHPRKELFINKLIIEDVDDYPFTKNLQIDRSIESQAKPYDAEFWKYYNVPAETAEESEIAENLKKVQLSIQR